jgi:hypothetical protein
LIVIGVVALLAVASFRVFGGPTGSTARTEGAHVSPLERDRPGANAPAPPPPPLPPLSPGPGSPPNTPPIPGLPSVSPPSASHAAANFVKSYAALAGMPSGYSFAAGQKLTQDTALINRYLSGDLDTGVTAQQDGDRWTFTTPDGSQYSTISGPGASKSNQLSPIASPGITAGVGPIAVGQELAKQGQLDDRRRYTLYKIWASQQKPPTSLPGYPQAGKKIRADAVSKLNQLLSGSP